MVVAPPAGSYLSRGGAGGHCRYPRTGVPPLAVSRREEPLVILNYIQQPDPCGPEALFTLQRSRTRPLVGKGPGAPRVPEEAGTQPE